MTLRKGGLPEVVIYPGDGTCAPNWELKSSGSPPKILRAASAFPDRKDVDLGDLYKYAKKGCFISPQDTQQWRHAYFVDPATGLPQGYGNADSQVDFYYGKAKEEFRQAATPGTAQAEHEVKGWMYLGMATHYVEDMGVSYHAGGLAHLERDR